MADSTSTNSTPLPAPIRSNRPLSESLLNEKWDHCLSTLLIRSTLGASFGIIFSVLLFKRRAFPVWTGLGFGAGRAWEECDSSFKRATAPSRDGLRVLRP
ncbi:MICOS complex subunit mic10 [Teratosphaeria destructans]|uniref:MICOS complex subunit MIC10 n=1 Tax=Teratosphaeria destructans TaxID=418781 RepID=A0A9W7SN09_9PEZI|nr:MICOS complex subunit mic10 [Teratosphaeria destructans]